MRRLHLHFLTFVPSCLRAFVLSCLRAWRRAQHVVIDDRGIYVFPICMRLRVNYRCRKSIFGRFRLRERKYSKLANRAGIAVVMRMITVSFMVVVSVMDIKTLTDMNISDCRR
jgi:hypothetical protein